MMVVAQVARQLEAEVEKPPAGWAETLGDRDDVVGGRIPKEGVSQRAQDLKGDRFAAAGSSR